MTALNTGIRMDRQLLVVPFCHFIASQSQIIIFIDQAHIQPHGAGLAMAAVDAHAVGILRRKFSDHRIIPLFF